MPPPAATPLGRSAAPATTRFRTPASASTPLEPSPEARAARAATATYYVGSPAPPAAAAP